VSWWALPESSERADRLLDEAVDQLIFLEDELGPYPFRDEKCSVVDTPYLAMEHQTAIALGLDGDVRRGGFAYILLHELTHEWWGNLVSAADWRDFWLHEGFVGYMEARFAERLGGRAAYLEYFREYFRPGILNQRPVAPRESRWMRQVFVTLEGEDGQVVGWDADSYLKGAMALHSLRYLVGDDVFSSILRRWAYPDPAMEDVVDGRQCRTVTTEQFIDHCERLSGRDLEWFFDVYLRQSQLPRLEHKRRGEGLELRWHVEGGGPFPMPIDVRIGRETVRVAMPDGHAAVSLPPGVEPAIDPDGWVLRTDASL
jgi:aminopeptidase N